MKEFADLTIAAWIPILIIFAGILIITMTPDHNQSVRVLSPEMEKALNDPRNAEVVEKIMSMTKTEADGKIICLNDDGILTIITLVGMA